MSSSQENLRARGQYQVRCLGPRNPADGIRIVAYVASHPELADNPSPNEEAARILGIELVDKWHDVADNLVVNSGKNHMLDNDLQTSVAIVGPYLGLISSVSYTAIAAADTMASHTGWKEAGNANAPTYSGNRKTAAWSAASAGSKSLSAALSFAVTGTGTVKGAFLVYGTSAVNTIDDTNGTLFSAGLFTTGDRAVLSGDTLSVSYSCSL